MWQDHGINSQVTAINVLGSWNIISSVGFFAMVSMFDMLRFEARVKKRKMGESLGGSYKKG